MELKDKVVLMTGASSGIGRAVAVQLGVEGAKVALVARREDQLDDVARAVRAAGGETLVLPADVSDREAAAQVVDAAQREWGHIDTVIANAGVGVTRPAHKLRIDDVEAMIRVNYLGAVYVVLSALPQMVERKSGHLVGVSSLAAYRGLPGSAGYSASKAALSAFFESLRVDLRPHGILVTTVHPGFVRTPMTDKNKFPMPFLMDVDTAARIMVQGIKAGRSEVNFPWQLAGIMTAVRRFPNLLFDRAFPKS